MCERNYVRGVLLSLLVVDVFCYSRGVNIIKEGVGACGIGWLG